MAVTDTHGTGGLDGDHTPRLTGGGEPPEAIAGELEVWLDALTSRRRSPEEWRAILEGRTTP